MAKADITLNIGTHYKGEGTKKLDAALKQSAQSAQKASQAMSAIGGELGRVGGKAGQAASAISGLFSVFTAGNPMAIAIAAAVAAVGLLVNAFVKAKEAAKAAGETIRKALGDGVTAANRSLERTIEMMKRLRGESEKTHKDVSTRDKIQNLLENVNLRRANAQRTQAAGGDTFAERRAKAANEYESAKLAIEQKQGREQKTIRAASEDTAANVDLFSEKVRKMGDDLVKDLTYLQRLLTKEDIKMGKMRDEMLNRLNKWLDKAGEVGTEQVIGNIDPIRVVSPDDVVLSEIVKVGRAASMKLAGKTIKGDIYDVDIGEELDALAHNLNDFTKDNEESLKRYDAILKMMKERVDAYSKASAEDATMQTDALANVFGESFLSFANLADYKQQKSEIEEKYKKEMEAIDADEAASKRLEAAKELTIDLLKAQIEAIKSERTAAKALADKQKEAAKQNYDERVAFTKTPEAQGLYLSEVERKNATKQLERQDIIDAYERIRKVAHNDLDVLFNSETFGELVTERLRAEAEDRRLTSKKAVDKRIDTLKTRDLEVFDLIKDRVPMRTEKGDIENAARSYLRRTNEAEAQLKRTFEYIDRYEAELKKQLDKRVQESKPELEKLALLFNADTNKLQAQETKAKSEADTRHEARVKDVEDRHQRAQLWTSDQEKAEADAQYTADTGKARSDHEKRLAEADKKYEERLAKITERRDKLSKSSASLQLASSKARAERVHEDETAAAKNQHTYDIGKADQDLDEAKAKAESLKQKAYAEADKTYEQQVAKLAGTKRVDQKSIDEADQQKQRAYAEADKTYKEQVAKLEPDDADFESKRKQLSVQRYDAKQKADAAYNEVVKQAQEAPAPKLSPEELEAKRKELNAQRHDARQRANVAYNETLQKAEAKHETKLQKADERYSNAIERADTKRDKTVQRAQEKHDKAAEAEPKRQADIEKRFKEAVEKATRERDKAKAKSEDLYKIDVLLAGEKNGYVSRAAVDAAKTLSSEQRDRDYDAADEKTKEAYDTLAKKLVDTAGKFGEQAKVEAQILAQEKKRADAARDAADKTKVSNDNLKALNEEYQRAAARVREIVDSWRAAPQQGFAQWQQGLHQQARAQEKQKAQQAKNVQQAQGQAAQVGNRVFDKAGRVRKGANAMDIGRFAELSDFLGGKNLTKDQEKSLREKRDEMKAKLFDADGNLKKGISPIRADVKEFKKLDKFVGKIDAVRDANKKKEALEAAEKKRAENEQLRTDALELIKRNLDVLVTKAGV